MSRLQESELIHLPARFRALNALIRAPFPFRLNILRSQGNLSLSTATFDTLSLWASTVLIKRPGLGGEGLTESYPR